jgi:predicted MFS family arabinose efflux permease
MPLRRIISYSSVPKSLAHNLVTAVHTGWAVMRSLVPAIGGILIAWVGFAWNFYIQSVCYALVIFTIFKINFPNTENPKKGLENPSIKESFKFIRAHIVTLVLLLLDCVLPLLIIPNSSTLQPIYAKYIFNGGSETLEIMLSIIGLGGFIGDLISSSLKEVDKREAIQFIFLFFTKLVTGRIWN